MHELESNGECVCIKRARGNFKQEEHLPPEMCVNLLYFCNNFLTLSYIFIKIRQISGIISSRELK